MVPGDVFVVVGAVAEAAVEDADEAVAQGAESLVVEVAGVASLVVEVAGAGAGRECAECPLVEAS